ncbi:GatB/YqeY domain-containing protein [Candidatus Wolfebacteria bacterium]|nr:GatB/YqeY domain-containing protein [Candidatus Wolfebacteria bacterium]
MTIHETLKKEIPDAMRAKDAVKLRTLRALITSFTNELITLKEKPDGFLTDDKALVVIKRNANQRKDSIEQFERGDRPDLARHEREELTILETYLPEMMSKEDILKVAKAKKEELKVTDKAKMGALMGAVMKELNGKADGNDVKEVLNSLFAE